MRYPRGVNAKTGPSNRATYDYADPTGNTAKMPRRSTAYGEIMARLPQCTPRELGAIASRVVYLLNQIIRSR
jgi:hypothetical protein